MLVASTAASAEAVSSKEKDYCECYRVIKPQHPHECQLCNRKISACLYTNELQHKITLQADEIKQLKKELYACELQTRKQQLEFQTLNTKYIATIDKIKEIQHQKEQADHELEDLSTRLFEEANNMVANEKKKRIHLQSKLEMTEDQLVNERNQLRELKSQMENLLLPSAMSESNGMKANTLGMNIEYTANHRSTNGSSGTKMLVCKSRRQSTIVTDSTSNGITDNIAQNKISSSSKRRYTVASSILSSSTISALNTPVVLYANKQIVSTFDFEVSQVKIFQAYLELYRNSSNISKRNCSRASSSSYFNSESDSEDERVDTLSIENNSTFFYYAHAPPPAQQSEYIAQCEKEDIEPCLGFGNSESRMCVKVMMEYMLHKPCFIEHITLDTAKSIPLPIHSISSAYYRPLWERWSATNTYYSHQHGELDYLECASCGKKTHINQPQRLKSLKFYRFRLVEEDDWLLIDHNCRNRLVAVCNFYSFVRNIQLGLYQNRSFDDLYQENVQLRLKMFYSRMGVI